MKWWMEKEDTGIFTLAQDMPAVPGCRLCCGVCAIAAFSDDDMNDLLLLDEVEQFVIYVATVGKK